MVLNVLMVDGPSQLLDVVWPTKVVDWADFQPCGAHLGWCIDQTEGIDVRTASRWGPLQLDLMEPRMRSTS